MPASPVEPQIPGYRIDKLLGRGGSASVYRAIQESLERLVALKILDQPGPPELAVRLAQESRLIASLDHYQLITIHDQGIVDGCYYIAMEYLEGGDLRSRIQCGLEPWVVARIIEQVACCLEYVHGFGVVHRDIKPGNILFRSDDTPVLTDFGVAKCLREDEASLTLTGTTVGTPYYMSPEQAQGRTLDGRADIYSLGVVFYEALTGQKPFKGDSHVSTLFMHLNEPVPRLPNCLSRYQDIIDRMLAKEPADRFEDAGEVCHALQAMARGPLRSATPTTTSLHVAPAWTAQAGAEPSTWDRLVRLRAIPLGLSMVAGLVIGSALVGLGTRAPDPEAAQAVRDASEQSPAPPSAAGGSEPARSLAIPGQVDLKGIQMEGAALPWPLEQASAPQSANDGSEASVEDRIEDLLRQAERALEESRLTSPADDNAWAFYQAALALDAHNAEASAGLARVASRYAALARHEIEEGHLEGARQFLRRGLRVQHNHPDLLALRRELGECVTAQNEPRAVPLDGQNAPGVVGLAADVQGPIGAGHDDAAQTRPSATSAVPRLEAEGIDLLRGRGC